MAKKKRNLTKSEEFDILKMVFNKFLLLGVLVIVLGLVMITFGIQDFTYGFTVMASGALIMLIFAIILVKEYNFIESK